MRNKSKRQRTRKPVQGDNTKLKKENNTPNTSLNTKKESLENDKQNPKN